MQTLQRVLHTLASNRLKLKREKCSFLKAEVNYLGHKLSSKGVHTSDDKVEALVNFPRPVNKQELSSFCGMVNYYQRFLPKVSEIMFPLYASEKDTSVWKWNKEEEEAFTKAKELLVSNTLFTH